jgi:hypothetical protein
LIDQILRKVGRRWAAYSVTLLCSLLAAGLLWSGIRRLDGIDTQFCILDDDDTEPDPLMPDVGRLIDRTFPPDAVIICNFDRYYSPLPYYARRVMTNDVHTYAEWQSAVSDAKPQPAYGILWAKAGSLESEIRNPKSEMNRGSVRHNSTEMQPSFASNNLHCKL